MKTVEICTSVEWLKVFSDIDFSGIDDIDDIDDAAGIFIDALASELACAGFEVINAHGQRATCYGWNGANTFEHRFGSACSSSYLTNEESATIQECIDIAEEIMRYSYCESPDCPGCTHGGGCPNCEY